MVPLSQDSGTFAFGSFALVAPSIGVMFGSVGFGELLLILLVALIIFGPHRLPEIARKVGELLSRARMATQELTDSLDAEYQGAMSPIQDLKVEYELTKQELTDTVQRVTDPSRKAPPEHPRTVELGHGVEMTGEGTGESEGTGPAVESDEQPGSPGQDPS